ncbi:hypothetical protein FK531_08750 [Rhodococcus spelaei]|uniref:Uncharacterized protein n=1 Tax=Rhodococcus spelaei TaxID=2546320 RepID=A0A541BMM2_9NOCA|nr:hypothetical protein [Rhodococcus spelaei]TQF73562.1 hypothetical protein FK531_08750 [Rhodococcus spelaei]
MERVRWWRRLFGGRRPVPLERERTDLVVVASGFDDVESCSTALERAAEFDPRWIARDEAVLRHHLLLPADRVQWAVEIAAQDDYSMATGRSAEVEVPEDGALVALVLQRTQILDALHCSQERSRMAGLAQRGGGRVLGWDALQPPRNPVGGTG